MKTLESLVAEKLLKIKAVKLQPANPFTWASGWKSPIYNDNRKTLSYPVVRSFIKLDLAHGLSVQEWLVQAQQLMDRAGTWTQSQPV